MAARLQRQVAIGHRGGQQAGGHGLGTVEDGGGDAFPVHRILQGQANVPLPGERLVGIEQYGPRGDGLADGRRIAPLTTDGVEIVQIEHVAIGPEHHIHVPLVQGQQDGLVVGHHLPAHGLQTGLLSPVRGIGREQGVLVLLVFLQDPRARAHEAAHAVARLAVDEAGRRDETERPQQPQLDESGIIGVLEYQTPGVAVHDFVAFDLVDHVQPGVAQAIGDDGIHVQADGLGIEGRPVAEGHTTAQMEGIDAAVGRDLPAFGQPGPDTFRRVDDQGLEDHALGCHLAAVQVRIDVPDVLGAGIDQLLARRTGLSLLLFPAAGQQAQAAEQQPAYQQFAHPHFFHRNLPTIVACF